MADRDPIDTNFLIVCIVALALLLGLSYKIFPHPDAPTGSAMTAPAKK